MSDYEMIIELLRRWRKFVENLDLAPELKKTILAAIDEIIALLERGRPKKDIDPKIAALLANLKSAGIFKKFKEKISTADMPDCFTKCWNAFLDQCEDCDSVDCIKKAMGALVVCLIVCLYTTPNGAGATSGPSSTDCGPAAPKSLVIKDVTGQGPNRNQAFQDAIRNAKSAGDSMCEGHCPGAKNCVFVLDSFEVGFPPAQKGGAQVTVTGTATGHCHCE